MREYSFVSIKVLREREGHVLAKDYREVIAKQAKKGWRFEQAISFESHTEPRLDLVFSRKAQK